jgi:hypothetical protein
MSSISGPGAQVLRGFIAAANAQYREAGLGEYQMRLRSDGTVSTPDAPAPEFEQPSSTGTAASEQAAAGASEAARSGDAPTVTSLQQSADGFALRWEAVADAKAYGIWVDGQLVGTVPEPAFDGTLAAGASGVVQVDAVRADGTRTALTEPLQVGAGSSAPTAGAAAAS